MSVPIPAAAASSSLPHGPAYCLTDCLTWPGRIYLGSGGEAAVLQLKKKQNKNPAESAQTMQRSQPPPLLVSPTPAPPRLHPAYVCLSACLVKPQPKPNFNFAVTAYFPSLLRPRKYTLYGAGCM